MKENLSEMEQKLKYFILHNEDFNNLAKIYTFLFRDFTPFVDYCKIIWKRYEKEWEFVEYYLHNEIKKLPSDEIRAFFLILSIDGYNWGSLMGEMEFQFDKNLEKNVMNEEIDKNSTEYKKLKNQFFVQHKENIINNWFTLNENTIEVYFKKTLKIFRNSRFEQVNRLMH